MKKTVSTIFALLFVGAFTLCAQQKLNLEDPIPTDPSVKVGVLKNGLTYYIKQNAKPENKAEMRLVLNAGSILEDEDQLGLAHFIEHMAFNGTKNFEKNKLIDHLQNLGIEFGADLNAHTSFDETVYKLSVPTDNKEAFGLSLQILRDWADGITFSDEEIDNERGVVAEELRSRSGAGSRMYYKSLPILTNNSRYANRAPIGTLDVIMNSEYNALKRFYKDWYRPDLMAIVMVGDFNLEETEAKIKSMFRTLKGPKKPKERVYYKVPSNAGIKVSSQADKEARGVTVSIYYKQEKEQEVTLKDLKQDLLQKMYSGMLRQRLAEIPMAGNAPFLSAKAGIGKFLGNIDSYYLKADLKEKQIEEGIERLLEESERVHRFGFTTTELERYKTRLLNSVFAVIKEKGKVSSKFYLEQYIDNFTDKVSIPSETFIYNFYQKIFPTIKVEDLSKVAEKWITEDNISVVINAPEKENLIVPDTKAITSVFKAVKNKKIKPYVDTLGDVVLLKKKPKKGTVVATEFNKELNVTTWKLANGVTILAKPTTLQNDMISMTGFRPGGSSTSSAEDYVSARNAGDIVGSSGVNDISAINLNKLIAGRTVKVTPRINFYDELFSGSSSSEDLELMLQLSYLYFIAPNKDESVFNSRKSRMLALYKDQDVSPDAYFEKKKAQIMTQNHLRGVPFTEEQVKEGLQFDKVFDFYKGRLKNANDFTFVFVGSFDLEDLKSNVIQYLGSLPSNTNENSDWVDFGLRRPEGVIKKTFYKGSEQKSKVDISFTGTLDFSLKKQKNIMLLGKALKIKLTQELREKMAGVYGVQVSGFATNKPNSWYRLNVRFTCAPKNVEKLKDKVYEEINKIKANGVSEIDLHKIKEAEVANNTSNAKYNSYWSYKLKNVIEYNLDMSDILNFNDDIKKLTSKDFKEIANTYFDEANLVELILMPEQKK
ncbi:insulinase family protein [Cellulophaga sp. 20_2_10]|uniref:M16 family metallopeptidase n=2 Tax=Cellulophaga TaxID=104264 RepID=UPI00201AEB75|nr:insulinase family protein [Cellulophaga sp. 20_2_10]MCL5246428.1 insulinase family protein [Cellulophaga sp. 20_2_10]